MHSLFSVILGLYTLVNLQATGVPLLTLGGKDPPKYALQLMGALFTEEEMAASCYKKCSAKVTKEELDQERKKKMEGKKHHEKNWFLHSYSSILQIASYESLVRHTSSSLYQK